MPQPCHGLLRQMSPAFLRPVHFPFPQPMVAVYNAGMEPKTPKPNHKRIARPTTQEIRRAHGQITEDGPESENPNLGTLAVTDPLLKEAIDRHTTNAIRLGLVGKHLLIGGESFDTVRAMVAGAILWGLHLGLHIGQNRAAVWPKPNHGWPFIMPPYCHGCGVYLMGGATKHQPDCQIQKIIDEATRVV